VFKILRSFVLQNETHGIRMDILIIQGGVLLTMLISSCFLNFEGPNYAIWGKFKIIELLFGEIIIFAAQTG
jgi:hypothetical protein